MVRANNNPNELVITIRLYLSRAYVRHHDCGLRAVRGRRRGWRRRGPERGRGKRVSSEGQERSARSWVAAALFGLVIEGQSRGDFWTALCTVMEANWHVSQGERVSSTFAFVLFLHFMYLNPPFLTGAAERTIHFGPKMSRFHRHRSSRNRVIAGNPDI